MGRHALLIGVSEFGDKRLARLNAPINDVIKLKRILEDTTRGRFDSIALSSNEDFVAVRDRLEHFYHDRAPDDLLLLYYSGHGILGRNNRLFLATIGSKVDTPRARSISASDIREFIADSRAQKQIVVLDCCHSGAFAELGKSAAPAPAITSSTFSSEGTGLYVLTAADMLQYAWDGAELRLGEDIEKLSLFTSWLVDGLENGEAAPDEEKITIDALYQYLFRRARSEGAPATPQRFVQEGVGDLVISGNPLAGSAGIDPEIVAALEDVASHRTRLGAVAELAIQIAEATPLSARAMRRLLQQRLRIERDYIVRRAIESALAETGARPPHAVLRASPETPPEVAAPSSAAATQRENGVPARQGNPQLADLDVFRDAPFAPELVVIPAGGFMMGSPDKEEGRDDDEGPQHRVTISHRFAIGRYAVTFAEYVEFCRKTKREKPGDEGWGRKQRPVINVSWDDAQAYIAWLSQEIGKDYRLPSEAEWEYACRAGTETRYSLGDAIVPKDANYADSGLGRTSEVGAYPANPWGLHDMHGNVWEWVEDDWQENYHGAPVDGSAWQDLGSSSNPRLCVLRGGSWNYLPRYCRSACRGRLDFDLRYNNVGFRVARTLS